MDLTVIIKIVAVGIITAIAAMILKKSGRDEIATVVSVVGLAIALIMMLDSLSQLYDTLVTLFDL